MAKAGEMCPYSGNRGYDREDRQRTGHHVFTDREVAKAQRKRVVCPVCKRRLIGWVTVLHSDCQDVLRVTVPRHKRKGWWKKVGRCRSG